MNKPNIVIACSSLTNKAEPFIEHIKRNINGNIFSIYGDVLPNKADCYDSLSYYPNIFERTYRKIAKNFGSQYDTYLIEGIKRFLLKHKIDLVLSEFGHTGAKMAPICKDLHIPHIVHFHGGGDVDSSKNIKNFAEEYLYMFQNASAIIGVSEDMKKDLLKICCPVEKIKIIPCGFDSVFLKLKSNFKEPIFLFYGRFVDQKAPYYLLQSFKIVKEKIPNAKLIMLGDGILLNSIINMSKYLNLFESLVMPGKVAHLDLPKYIEKSFCYVQHSIVAMDGCSEGTPVSILEASASGLPVISTRHKGIKQAVIHGETGYLVEEHDVNGMANFMIELANDLPKSKQMGEAGRKHILKNYSMEKYIGAIDDLINRILYNV